MNELVRLDGLSGHRNSEEAAPTQSQIERSFREVLRWIGVVGISKLARVVEAYAKRLKIQERLTAQVANTIEKDLKPQGVAVVIKAAHHCMSSRGVHMHGTELVMSRVLGCFREITTTRQEFMSMVHSSGEA